MLARLVRVVLPLVCVGAIASLPAQQDASPPPVEVTVHEPLELLCVVARFAGHPEYQPRTPEPAYSKSVAKHFAAGREHDAVARLRELRRAHGIGYDAIASLAVHLGPLPELAPLVPFAPHPPSLDARWRDADPAAFVATLRQFASATDAEAFFASNRRLYERAAERLAERLQDSDALPWFDEFFGARPGARCIAHVGLQCGGHNYGTSVRSLDGGIDQLRPVFGCWRFDQDGTPRFGAELLPLFVHELCHTWVNPIVEQHLERLSPAGERLFCAHAEVMQRQAYGNGRTLLCETLVRACVIRCVTDTDGEAAGRKQAAQETRAHFTWAPELAELLRDYQRDRERYATFEAFVPKLAEALDRIAARFPAVDDAAPQLVACSPANGSTDVDPALRELRFTFDRAMADQSWSVVGDPAQMPKLLGSPEYDRARRVLTIRVELEGGRDYRFSLNSPDKQGFRSERGAPLAPVVVTFRTR